MVKKALTEQEYKLKCENERLKKENRELKNKNKDLEAQKKNILQQIAITERAIDEVKKRKQNR